MVEKRLQKNDNNYFLFAALIVKKTYLVVSKVAPINHLLNKKNHFAGEKR